MTKRIFVLGATGFIGRELVKEAVNAGWRVDALTRSTEAADQARRLGAFPVDGDALNTASWMSHAQTADVLIDLVQPALPPRLGNSKMREIVTFRKSLTKAVLDGLADIPLESRPLLLSVSGTDDLQPDSDGCVNARSPLRTKASGFGQIGIPVSRLIQASGIAAVQINLGHVYGPGKFTERTLPALARGKFPVIGRGENHLPFVHVEDAARALLHVAGMDRASIAGKRYVVADTTPVTLKQFINTMAAAINAPRPKHIPRWLAALVAGGPMVSEMTSNLFADPSALLASGFCFRYSSLNASLPAMLASFGNNVQHGENRYA